ncbi:E3 ubiquitin-protein ligase FANCL isoform X2 [Herrania umbratica]|uniref:E3 ubiquitin-protein ligase FANCL isoform X2 n=1 Tax=Herrania umbratica TaxID=108875 RepID=A0A6J0ZIR5_9ROSI|nr:E3 ubiquitin-protein ligase FANCL isoform X2 [Herrania umbratica]
MEVNEQARCRELAKSSSFYRTVYSEVEEVGWEHLVRLDGDLTFLSFRVLDKKGRVHIMEIQLDKAYPRVPPMVSADVPYIFNLKWSMNSRLKNLVQQFQEHLEKLQGFWSTLDEIDRSLWVVESKQASRAMSCRQIHEMIASSCCALISMTLDHYQSTIVNSLRKIWKRNSNKWMSNKPFTENIECLLETQLPRPPDKEENNLLVECGICYAQYLPIGDELVPKSGSGTDYTCENNNCSKAFHSMCLVDWLRSITTTRQSFNVLFGNCPYCSEPVAVKTNTTKN